MHLRDTLCLFGGQTSCHSTLSVPALPAHIQAWEAWFCCTSQVASCRGRTKTTLFNHGHFIKMVVSLKELPVRFGNWWFCVLTDCPVPLSGWQFRILYMLFCSFHLQLSCCLSTSLSPVNISLRLKTAVFGMCNYFHRSLRLLVWDFYFLSLV